MSPDLLEAELFGAEAGAYTGATKRRIGRFERADGGTLFLDEIGNLPMAGQAKLLRVLETGEFERLGGSETVKVKVRIISATNTDIPAAIEAGLFREDLYYRLNVIKLKIPALSTRKDDILPLVNTFLAGEFSLDEESIQLILHYHWPGNVRELLNVITRAKLLSPDKVITPQYLAIEVKNKQPDVVREEVTEQDITTAITQCNGVISEAARFLGLSRSALYRRMKKFNISY